MKDGIYFLKGIPMRAHSKLNEQQKNPFLKMIISVNTVTITDTVLNKSRMSLNILMHMKIMKHLLISTTLWLNIDVAVAA